MRLQLYVWFNQLMLRAEFWRWRKTHTMKDFEARMIELGCTKVHSRSAVIFTTPNGLGKIVVTDSEILINPK